MKTAITPGMFKVLMVCGMRRLEIFGLAFYAIDLHSETISIFRTVVAGEKGEPILRDERAKSETWIRTISIPSEFVPMIGKHRTLINEMILKRGKSYQREPLSRNTGSAMPPRRMRIWRHAEPAVRLSSFHDMQCRVLVWPD